jgi:flagellar assembly protein FliH
MTGLEKRFGFDTVFDAEGGVVFSTPRPKRLFTADEVEQIRALAFSDGQNSELVVAEQATAAAVSEIAQACGVAMSALAKVAHDHRTASAELAMAVGRKVADAALEQFPEAPISAAMIELARELEAAPRLMVRTTPDRVEPVQAALERAAQACGFAGQITAIADPALPLAAFLLDWGEGRAAFDPEAAAGRVAAALETALAAEGLHAEPLIPPSILTTETPDG